ncbi:MAG: hypothetical protein KF791_10300 [Verrucomicrobiae bacterium]|nr:hypothetical protein [Verrucomicrobiae bacterium]
MAGGLLALPIAAEAPPVGLVNISETLAMQRTLTLFSPAPSGRRPTVRVVIYGQSISRQEWAWELMRELPRRFPHAEVQVHLQAISSFNADSLIRTAEADVYPLLPDLILFHCYGPYLPGQSWEQLLRAFRTRTTADVLLLGNHPVAPWELDEPMNSAAIDFETFPSLHGPAWVNYVRIPALSRDLGFCNPDNRSAWKRYLRDQGLMPQDLLSDHIHLNLRGSDLLKAIVLPYLEARPMQPPLDPFNNGRVRTHPVGTGGLDWIQGRLRLPFTGNRVDLLAAGGDGGPCRVLVDGRPPSQWPSGTGHSRTSTWIGETDTRPALLRVASLGPLVAEEWSLTVTEADPVDRRRFRFRVEGSVTGADGEGTSTERFVSDSGRVVIEPSDWNFIVLPPANQVGARISWTARMLGVDVYEPPPLRALPLETWVNLVHDLTDGPHVLELEALDAANPPPLEAVRIHHPAGPLPGTEIPEAATPTLRYLIHREGLMTVWPAAWTGGVPLQAVAPGGPWLTTDRMSGETLGFRFLVTPMDAAVGYVGLGRPLHTVPNRP